MYPIQALQALLPRQERKSDHDRDLPLGYGNRVVDELLEQLVRRIADDVSARPVIGEEIDAGLTKAAIPQIGAGCLDPALFGDGGYCTGACARIVDRAVEMDAIEQRMDAGGSFYIIVIVPSLSRVVGPQAAW
jgi:hypothetical protein